MHKYEGVVVLNGNNVPLITSGLRSHIALDGVKRIKRQLGIAYEGVKPGNNEFVISDETRQHLISMDTGSEEVMVPFLIGRDVNRSMTQEPSRWVIDFNDRSKEESKKYRAAFSYVQKHVYPARMSEFDRKLPREKEMWWQFERPRPEMRSALSALNDYIVTPVTSPHVIFTITSSENLADHALKALALDTHYHYGILQSAIHEYWAWARGSTLEERLRYTNTTIFETFPFPLLDCRNPLAGGREG